jgi:hypothetical protein
VNDHIEKANPPGLYGSAIYDLLHFIPERLLVVSLPSNRRINFENNNLSVPQPGPGESMTQYQATALEIRTELDGILAKAGQPGHLLGERAKDYIPTPSFTPSDLLSPPATCRWNGLAPFSYPKIHVPIHTTDHQSNKSSTSPPNRAAYQNPSASPVQTRTIPKISFLSLPGEHHP